MIRDTNKTLDELLAERGFASNDVITGQSLLNNQVDILASQLHSNIKLKLMVSTRYRIPAAFWILLFLPPVWPIFPCLLYCEYRWSKPVEFDVRSTLNLGRETVYLFKMGGDIYIRVHNSDVQVKLILDKEILIDGRETFDIGATKQYKIVLRILYGN